VFYEEDFPAVTTRREQIRQLPKVYAEFQPVKITQYLADMILILSNVRTLTRKNVAKKNLFDSAPFVTALSIQIISKTKLLQNNMSNSVGLFMHLHCESKKTVPLLFLQQS